MDSRGYHDVSASPLFRKIFRLKKPVVSARAYVCGLGFHEFFLNGRKVGDAVLHQAFTKYDARVLYTVHDITGYLAQGDNAVGIMVGTGCYNPPTGDEWDLYKAAWRDECKALIQIEIVFADGSRTAQSILSVQATTVSSRMCRRKSTAVIID